mgnify:CR=1 FL=1
MSKLEEYINKIQERCDAAKAGGYDEWVNFEDQALQDVEVLLEMVKLLKEGMEQVVNNSDSGWHTEKEYLDKVQKLLTKGDE